MYTNICIYIYIYKCMYVYIYIWYPPYADLSHVPTAIGGSAPVRSAERAYFHLGKTWPQGDVRLQKTNFLMFLSRRLELYPYYVSGSKFGFKSWAPNPKCSSIQVFQVLMMSRAAKALLQHPACSVLLLSFELMMSPLGVHDSKRQKKEKTVDVVTLAMTISALPYSLGCTLP